MCFDQLRLDAGYDSEANHTLLREAMGVESIIPAKTGQPTNRLPVGRRRWWIATHFDEDSYAQRRQVETVMFMLKSRLGQALSGRSNFTRRQEMGLMALTHNLMILLLATLFYRALPSLFLRPFFATDGARMDTDVGIR